MKNGSMNKTAKTLDAIVKLIGGFAEAFAIVCGVFALLVAVLGEKMYVPGSMTLELGFVELKLAEELQVITTPVILYTVFSLVAGGILCLLVFFGTKLLRKILAPMKDGRPFEADTAKNIRSLAWLSLIGGGVHQLCGLAEQLLIAHAYPLEAVFASDAIVGTELLYSMDLGFVAVFFILLFLSCIFSYGQSLQQEADETL